MAILAGRHHLDTHSGRILLKTLRDGLAAQAGHDLTVEAGGWSGDLEVAADLTPVRLDVRIDMGSLVARAGSGGLKPLTERDKQEIAATARKVLGTARHPDATFSATSFEQSGSAGAGTITGTLTLAGRSRPLSLEVRQPGPGRYVATASVTQSDFGIKPYTAFLGSLKVRDAVGVEIEITLPEGPAETGGSPGTTGAGETGGDTA